MTRSNEDEFFFNLKGKKHGGRLEGWTTDMIVGDDDHMWGEIYESPAEQFKDGDVVHTSRIIKMHKKEDKPYILETRHSYYYLGKLGGRKDLEVYYTKVYKDRDN